MRDVGRRKRIEGEREKSDVKNGIDNVKEQLARRTRQGEYSGL